MWVTMSRGDCNWRSSGPVRLVDVMVGLWSFGFRVAPSNNPGKDHPCHPCHPIISPIPAVETKQFHLAGLAQSIPLT